MIEIGKAETPPAKAGWYTYRFSNGFQTSLCFDGNRWLTAAGQPHRMMPGDTWHVLTVKSKFDSIFKQVKETSRQINDNRTLMDVLGKSMEELGELSQEVLISLGKHYKEPGKDGVVGEALDVIVCMCDMILRVYPEIKEEVLQEILEQKLTKWQETVENKHGKESKEHSDSV